MRIKIYLLQNMRIKDVFICVRSITIPKKGNAKECSNYHIIALISHASMEKAMAPHSSTLAWKIPWTEEPGGLPSMGSHRVGHD